MKRSFIHLKRAHYGKAVLPIGSVVDEVQILLTLPGGYRMEAKVSWYDMGGFGVMPNFNCYGDGWSLLPHLAPVFEKMAAADNPRMTPDEFCAILAEAGFEDATEKK